VSHHTVLAERICNINIIVIPVNLLDLSIRGLDIGFSVVYLLNNPQTLYATTLIWGLKPEIIHLTAIIHESYVKELDPGPPIHCIRPAGYRVRVIE
jgi:hypothetical protein